MSTVSIIVPTIGRPTLARTLDAAEPQLRAGDEVLVVGNLSMPRNDAAFARHEVEKRRNPALHYFEHGIGGGFGDAQRNYGMTKATGSHLAFIDDDDAHRPDALALFHQWAGHRPVLFRMQHYALGVLWRDKSFICGNVGTPMYLVPNARGKLGRWEVEEAGTRVGDWNFIRDTVRMLDQAIIWRPEIVADVYREETPE